MIQKYILVVITLIFRSHFGHSTDSTQSHIENHYLYLGQTLSYPLPFVPEHIQFHPNVTAQPSWDKESASLRLVSKKKGTSSIQVYNQHHKVEIHVTVLDNKSQHLATTLEKLSLRGANIQLRHSDSRSQQELILTGTLFSIKDWIWYQHQLKIYPKSILSLINLPIPHELVLLQNLQKEIQDIEGVKISFKKTSHQIYAEGHVASKESKKKLTALLHTNFQNMNTDQIKINLSALSQINLSLQFIEVDSDHALKIGINHNNQQFSWSLPEKALSFMSQLTWLLSEGKAKILSKPNLVARYNHVATLHIGGEIPYEIKSHSRLNVHWKQYGIQLKITPNPLPNNTVHLIFDISVSYPMSGGQTTQALPSFSRRALSSEVIMSLNQTAILSGLIQQMKELNENGLPFLSSIPVLGHFFKQTSENSKITELIIALTPQAYSPFNLKIQKEHLPQLKNKTIYWNL
jgi:hypothetical protein